jgi:hypothetical protein
VRYDIYIYICVCVCVCVCIYIYIYVVGRQRVKPLFCRYCRKFLVTTSSAEMAEGCIDTLLDFQIFLISSAKFSCSVIFSATVLGRIWVNVTAVSVTTAVLFCKSIGALSGLLKSTAVSALIVMSEYKIMPADTSSGSGLCLQYGGVFISSSLH